MHKLYKMLTATACCVAITHGAFAQSLPGEGKTIRFARGDSLGANYIQDDILIQGLEKLGYDVKLTTVSTIAFFQAASQGDLDVAADINIPQEIAAYEPVKDTVELVGDGNIVGGGTNGYLVDKKTAETYKLTNFEQLKDPKIAALFDANGDGKADLVNCDPGWQCGDVVDYQVEKFGLADTVKTVRGKYEVLLAETFARFKRGEPTLVYTWQPSWVTDTLKPGTETVWLPIPYDAMPDNIANRDFIAENPAVRAFLAEAKWPTSTWAEWESELNKDTSDRAIKTIADGWIAKNQAQFDTWVEAATKAVD